MADAADLPTGTLKLVRAQNHVVCLANIDGHIYAVDTHNGKTMIMVATSTKSNYNILGAMRLKLAKHYLAKTKDNIVSWLQNLGVSQGQ